MEYEDRVTIETPEGVPVDLLLAGYGSRFSSQLIDGAIKLGVMGALWAALGLAGAFGEATAILVIFVVYVGYDIVFETLADGRTPGKRWSGMRVVREGGEPITFTPSAIRNIVRLIDGIGTSYAAGTISILVSKRNQRLGDMAANTLVVREASATATATTARTAGTTAGDAWDVTGISAQELATVRSFLERRYQLEGGPRSQLARQLADGLRAKVAGAADDLPPERFLEALAAAKARRS